jgi:hypothetical protein
MPFLDVWVHDCPGAEQFAMGNGPFIEDLPAQKWRFSIVTLQYIN